MTPERLDRINHILDNRQPDLTVCLEGVHKTHNLSAIVRTADAVGVHQAHAVLVAGHQRMSSGTALGSQNWVNVKTHDDIKDAITQMKAQNMQILATHLSDTAVDFREIDYTKPTAILLGQEKFGISEAALEMADQHIIIPMVGMVQSLNVSVASATILYEAQRQRALANMYGTNKLPESERQRVLFEGGHPIFCAACKRKGLPYPQIDEQGEIVADEQWWAQMQMTEKAWKQQTKR